MAMVQPLMHYNKIERTILKPETLYILHTPRIGSKSTSIDPRIKIGIKIRNRNPAKPQPMKNIAVIAAAANHQHTAIQPHPPIVKQSSQRLRVKIIHALLTLRTATAKGQRTRDDLLRRAKHIRSTRIHPADCRPIQWLQNHWRRQAKHQLHILRQRSLPVLLQPDHRTHART
jgi:hypothetical protein